jgi:hypothetical protein
MQHIIMQTIASLLVDHLSLAHTINYVIFFLMFSYGFEWFIVIYVNIKFNFN